MAAAAVIDKSVFSTRLPDGATIFTAEAKAIQLAFEYIKSSTANKFTIYSDSLSCLQSIKNMKIEQPYILDLLVQYYHLTHQGKVIEFCWIPSHIGIPGNTKADGAAKTALQYDVTFFKIPYTDIKYFVKLYVNSLWQIYWEFCDTNKLYAIENKVNKSYNFGLKRQDEVIISRIRIGHSKITHEYLITRELQPECISCECPLTISHILLECIDFSPCRDRLFKNVQTMHELFANINVYTILEFLRETDFYCKI